MSSAPLPEWVFDVHETDLWPEDESGARALMDELEIDADLIRSSLWYTLLAPFLPTLPPNDSSEGAPANPFLRHGDKLHHDFWGPCLVVTAFGVLLSIGRVYSVSWVYVVWLLASMAHHLISRTWSPTSTFALHCAVSGYSVLPFIPVSMVVYLLRPAIVVSLALTYLAVLWSSLAALKVYWQMNATASPEDRRKLVFLVPSVVLMELYFSSLLPMIM